MRVEIDKEKFDNLLNAIECLLVTTWDFDERKPIAPSNGVRIRLRDAMFSLIIHLKKVE